MSLLLARIASKHRRATTSSIIANALAYWPLDVASANSGATIPDATGHGYDASMLSTQTVVSLAPFKGNGIAYNGSGVAMAKVLNVDEAIRIVDDLTIWAVYNKAATGGYFFTCAQDFDELSSNWLWALGAGLNPSMFWEYGTGVNVGVVGSSQALQALGEFHLVSATRDHVNKVVRFYVDGTLTDTVSFGNNPQKAASGNSQLVSLGGSGYNSQNCTATLGHLGVANYLANDQEHMELYQYLLA